MWFDAMNRKFTQEELRAKKILNQGYHQHPPPSTYFIRRSPHLLEKYMKKDEMDQIIRESSPEFKLNYELFHLEPSDRIRSIKQKQHLRQQMFRKNQDDPFFNKYLAHYQQRINSLRNTKDVIEIVTPRKQEIKQMD